MRPRRVIFVFIDESLASVIKESELAL